MCDERSYMLIGTTRDGGKSWEVATSELQALGLADPIVYLDEYWIASPQCTWLRMLFDEAIGKIALGKLRV